MTTELIGGILIGLMIDDWLGRLVLPAAVGLFACGELFFLRRRRLFPARWGIAWKREGTSEAEIAETEQEIKGMLDAPSREIGLIGWRVYALQFVWSTATTFPIALVSGLIRDWLT